jgi:hypothetical protein
MLATISPYFTARTAAVYTVIWRPKAEIKKSEYMFIARQRLGKQITAATNTQATIK